MYFKLFNLCFASVYFPLRFSVHEPEDKADPNKNIVTVLLPQKDWNIAGGNESYQVFLLKRYSEPQVTQSHDEHAMIFESGRLSTHW